ncbi:hypothetical protein SAMN04515648_2561 [Phyllobacterium sp. CL33Tsu]|uniref:SDR family NAD(P)-dependent oxidoreductase n=1 Tax=Phyllobacterium sp. CL33Tsu TaxID=1798191 RepID=UPI0008E2419C|nr:SDR family NAD(P)-dependent oxidoreductase [Phyllobacterium sp. CL33Tsu]SFJ03467.1 hypothetical protein SAMN04515648_2561 [Phyllobacterium sp. CL33Tsu]
MNSLRENYNAVVVGSSGGIGQALRHALVSDTRANVVQGVDRTTFPHFELGDENSIVEIADDLRQRVETIDVLIVATGILRIGDAIPEKSLAALDGEHMMELLRINAVGPALILKHFSPLVSKKSKAIIALLSARVGSIGDNRLGGWLSYRASKAALNQIVKTASIEFARTHPQCLCVALHPGTVDTKLSRPFAANHPRSDPAVAAASLLNVIDQLTADRTGTFIDYNGCPIEW